MNVYGKLQKCRVELQKMELKKSGENKFAKFTYYELADILPAINTLMAANGLSSYVNFLSDIAVLTIIDTDKEESKIEFTCPVVNVELKGCTPIQGLGAMQTYIRRYLYINAFEIVEADALDLIVGKEASKLNSNPREKKLVELANTKSITIAQLKTVIKKEFNKLNISDLTDTEYKQVWDRIEKK